MIHPSPAHAGVWCARHATSDRAVMVGNQQMFWIASMAWLVTPEQYAQWRGEMELAMEAVA